MNDLKFKNSFGGFSEKGDEYLINFSKSKPTPRPWSNVITNENFGCLVSESSLGMTWYQNSKDKRITAWLNDWVTDSPSEVIYIKDIDTKKYWSATPNPYCEEFKINDTQFHAKHGLGFTSYQHEVNDIESELKVFVDGKDPVKILHLKLKNKSSQKRKFAIYYFLETVLGSYRNQFDNFVRYQFLSDLNSIIFYRTDKPDFQTKMFVTASEDIHSWTSNKNLFIGFLGSHAHPEGLKLDKLHNEHGVPQENCLVFNIETELLPNEEKEITFLLGVENGEVFLNDYKERYFKRDAVEKSLLEVQDFWKGLNSSIQIKTPDERIDTLFNNWVLYQVLACRVWGRSSFYQSSGAFGFRDQLQDVLAFLNSNPDLTRQQILMAARRQFVEGDVQHWWFEESGLGVRNKVSDSALWLPYVVATYIDRTGDWDILNQEIPYLEGRELTSEEPAYVEIAKVSELTETLFEHCLKAIHHVSDFGMHGLPLMKEGDWNDGMNLVGKNGVGESIWLGWFLVKVLKQFIEIVEKLGKEDIKKELEGNLETLSLSLKNTAWDGEWYLRAFTDDGMKLGSVSSIDCKIDSISQSWAVIADVDSQEHQMKAIDAALKYLVDKEHELVFLLTPAFDESPINPGYIKDYPPGIRENGGQYSHSVFWLITALVHLKKFDEAFDLLLYTNPIHHSLTDEKIHKYKTESYAIVGDIYHAPEHLGKGGWSWYTGSAGLTYTTILEQILGFKRSGNSLRIVPGVPKSWKNFEIKYQYLSSSYTIKVNLAENHSNIVQEVKVDDSSQSDFVIPLRGDGSDHLVEIKVG